MWKWIKNWLFKTAKKEAVKALCNDLKGDSINVKKNVVNHANGSTYVYIALWYKGSILKTEKYILEDGTIKESA